MAEIDIDIPTYFLCPITLDIMKDPVTICTGITYDREGIEHWIFSQKKNTCPSTKQLLENPDLTPNITLRRLIQSWCHLHAADGVQRLPTPKSPVTTAQLHNLLKHPTPKSLQTLKFIASENQTNRRCIEASSAPSILSSLIVEKTAELSRAGSESEDLRKICNEALSILHTLNLNEFSLKALANLQFIDSLTIIMNSGSYESRAYAIMLLKSMAEVSDPTLLIGFKPAFFSELGKILSDEVSEKASKAALKVLISACPWGRNRIKAVENGVVPVLIDLLLDSSAKRTAEMILMVLDLVCQCAEGRAELLKHGAGLAVVSKKIFRVSQVASERGVRILYSISRFSATKGVLMEMLQIGVVAKLCLVVQVDCGSKMKERAKEILKLHARQWRNSPCIPSNLISSYPS
ncbi:hypothetical protein ACS0TY_016393 [Phlomoides rotata]